MLEETAYQIIAGLLGLFIGAGATLTLVVHSECCVEQRQEEP